MRAPNMATSHQQSNHALSSSRNRNQVPVFSTNGKIVNGGRTFLKNGKHTRVNSKGNLPLQLVYKPTKGTGYIRTLICNAYTKNHHVNDQLHLGTFQMDISDHCYICIYQIGTLLVKMMVIYLVVVLDFR